MALNVEAHVAASGDNAFQAAGNFDDRFPADNPQALDGFMNAGPGRGGEGSAAEVQPGLAGPAAVEPLGTATELAVGSTIQVEQVDPLGTPVEDAWPVVAEITKVETNGSGGVDVVRMSQKVEDYVQPGVVRVRNRTMTPRMMGLDVGANTPRYRTTVLSGPSNG